MAGTRLQASGDSRQVQGWASDRGLTAASGSQILRLPRWRRVAETAASDAVVMFLERFSTAVIVLDRCACLKSLRFESCWSGRRRWTLRSGFTEPRKACQGASRWCSDISFARRRSRCRPNIAEGFSRHSRPTYVNHLWIAHGSGAELETQVEVGRRVDLIDMRSSEMLIADAQEVGRMLNGLVRSLELTASEET